ncbi:MAG: glycosyltransferase family 39 protein [Gemmatimonadales bacterium]
MTRGASAPGEHTGGGSRDALLIVGLIAVAAALRFLRLGEWNFDSDEIFMLRDSINLQGNNPRPLLYVLNHYLVLPFLPFDEFSLRLLPAIFGVLAIPTLYLVGRRLVGSRAALFGALLLTVSGLHIYYSQFARYWTLVFLLSAIYPYALYIGLRERNPRAFVLGLVTGGLAVISHPASVLLMGGFAIWMAITYLKPDHMVRLWRQKNVQWGVLLLVIVAVGVVWRFIPLLRGWISQRDRIPRGEFLLHLPGIEGVKELLILSAYVESLTLPLVLFAAIGIAFLWHRDRPLAMLLTSMFIFPVAFILLLSFRTPISTFYLVPASPIIFLAAGVFLDRLAEVEWELRPRWLIPAAVTAVILATGAPTLISQYRDGRRYDFRGAAEWLSERRKPGDIVFSDQPQVMTHYLGGAEAQRLVPDLPLLTRSVHQLSEPGSVWIVAPYTAKGSHRTNPKIISLKSWIYDNCRLRNAVGVARLDFRVNELQIFECSPAQAGVRPSAGALAPLSRDLNPLVAGLARPTRPPLAAAVA